MTKLKVSEIFYSLQGEGRFVGVPSVFLRTFGCNFTCGGFGMPAGERSLERTFVVPENYQRFEDLPLVHTGCDSYASWDPRFKHLSPTLEINAVVDALLDLTPNRRWLQSNGNDVHLVITGGEPLLGWQRAYPDLLDHERMSDLANITFETNGTQQLSADFKSYLRSWNQRHFPNGTGGEITFSVSPKLSASGEAWDEAVRPEVVAEYESVGHTYLKFVVEHRGHFDEVDRAVAEYRAAGFLGDVYVMPVGGVVSVYDGNKFNVAEEALWRGYRYSPRLHVDIWGNGWGK
jgi:organic radical activating enzyme